jgi:hypothetical protein
MQTTFKHILLAQTAAAGLSGLCGISWQGDFGKGVPTGSGIWSDPGANPCVLMSATSSSGTGGNGIFQPQFRIGMIMTGDLGAEFVLCKLVLAGTTDLLPGDVYFADANYALTLLSATNASNIIGSEVVVGQVFAPATVAGTYYLWGQRAGRAAVRAIAASVANGAGETNATTAGTLKFPAAASPTAGQKSVSPTQAYVASSGLTFTANTVNGSPYLSAVVSASSGGGVSDLVPGMTITGTGLPANSCIAAIERVSGVWRISIGTATTGAQSTLQNATATGTAVTFTVTTHVAANLYWPTLAKQN